MDKRLGAAGLALGLSLTLAACSGGAGSTAPTGGGTPTEAAGAPETPEAGGGAGASAAAGGGANGFEGTLASSGLYSANWTVNPETEPNPINASNNPSLVSDKNTFGNIKVETDGSTSFGSAAAELNANGSYDGTGAKVTLDPTGQFVCAFTIDNDLKGSNDGAVLHMSGGLTVHWHPEGVGDLSCP